MSRGVAKERKRRAGLRLRNDASVRISMRSHIAERKPRFHKQRIDAMSASKTEAISELEHGSGSCSDVNLDARTQDEIRT